MLRFEEIQPGVFPGVSSYPGVNKNGIIDFITDFVYDGSSVRAAACFVFLNLANLLDVVPTENELF